MIIVNNSEAGVFSIQDGNKPDLVFSKVFVVKTLENTDSDTGEDIVQISSHLYNEVFTAPVSGWSVGVEPFTTAKALCSVLDHIVRDEARINGDTIVGATINGADVPVVDSALILTNVANDSQVQTIQQN